MEDGSAIPVVVAVAGRVGTGGCIHVRQLSREMDGVFFLAGRGLPRGEEMFVVGSEVVDSRKSCINVRHDSMGTGNKEICLS